MNCDFCSVTAFNGNQYRLRPVEEVLEELELFRDSGRYILKSRLDAIQVSILTPMPGTQVYHKMVQENRLGFNRFPDDWKYYHAADVIFRPKNMKPAELAGVMSSNIRRIYRKHVLLKRFLQALIRTRKPGAALWSFLSNSHYRNIWYEKGITVFSEINHDPD